MPVSIVGRLLKVAGVAARQGHRQSRNRRPFVEAVEGRCLLAVAAAVPPTVVAVQRSGIQHQPTRFILNFSSPLDPARAQDVGNYVIRNARGSLIAVDSAAYNASAQTVTLTTQSLNAHRPYRLTVNGTAPDGVAGVTGLLLDGADNGQQGSNFVTTLNRRTLQILPSPTVIGIS